MNGAGVAAALASGCLLAVMTQLNGELAQHGGAFLASWAAHGLGAIVAGAALAALRRPPAPAAATRAPIWAYAGGLSGAATVIMTSAAVNSPLALAGTLSLGLVGQAAFSLAADRWGLLGLQRRRLGLHDLIGLCLIVAGSIVLLLAAKGAP